MQRRLRIDVLQTLWRVAHFLDPKAPSESRRDEGCPDIFDVRFSLYLPTIPRFSLEKCLCFDNPI